MSAKSSIGIVTPSTCHFLYEISLKGLLVLKKTHSAAAVKKETKLARQTRIRVWSV